MRTALKQSWLSAHVSEISSYDTWVSYSPKTLGKLWVGSYWANFKDGNKNSSYLRGQYKKGARSFIKGALDSRKSTTTYTKTGWGPFTRAGNIYNDAGIVVKKRPPIYDRRDEQDLLPSQPAARARPRPRRL